jgi:hypothetical protein
MRVSRFFPGLAFLVVSCSDPASYQTSVKTQAQKTTNSSPSDQATKAETENVKNTSVSSPSVSQNCDSLATRKTDTLKVNIPKNDPKVAANRCPFGVADNNPVAGGNGKFSARIERRFDVKIPVDRTVCSMKASSPEQTLEYDDQIILTLNDYVLISSGGLPMECHPLSRTLSIKVEQNANTHAVT